MYALLLDSSFSSVIFTKTKPREEKKTLETHWIMFYQMDLSLIDFVETY